MAMRSRSRQLKSVAKVKYHAIQAFISGTKRNGSKKTGFMITGKPNSIGWHPRSRGGDATLVDAFSAGGGMVGERQLEKFVHEQYRHLSAEQRETAVKKPGS
jgi:hypothetical protein